MTTGSFFSFNISACIKIVGHGGVILSTLGWIVRKLIGSNPRLRDFLLYKTIKVVFIARFLWRLRLVDVKTRGRKYEQKTLVKSYKTEIKIHAYPGLASSASSETQGQLVGARGKKIGATKGFTKVYKEPTLTRPFSNGSANAGSWLGRKILCIILPNRRTAASELLWCVLTWPLLHRPYFSGSYLRGKLSF